MSQVNIVVPPFTMEQSIGIEQAYFTPNVMIHFYAKFLRRPHTEDEQAYFTPNVMIHFYAKFLRRPHTEDDLKQGTEGAAKALDLVEKNLADKPYLAGQNFSLAGIAWMPYLRIARDVGLGDLLQRRPHVNDWATRVSGRPSFGP
ncbi:MAG: glutathione S-transferase C-terminal domain-containing protein [Polyangiaceae bacterium]|nr:glutathione S-transferase C-terminal domain-containing protein [Polyangiaceae bacterium]